MTIIPFKAIYPNSSHIGSFQSFFDKVKNEFSGLHGSGHFLQDQEEAIFVYDIIRKEHTHTGVLTCLDVNDFKDGNIARHERTMPDKEAYLKQLFLERKAMIKPILLSYKRENSIDQILKVVRLQKPFFQVVLDDNEHHVLYKVSDPTTLETLRTIFKDDVTKSYIADGHHRCTTYVNMHNTMGENHDLGDFSKMLCVLFPFDDMIIHDFNRIITITDEIQPSELLEALRSLCLIEKLSEPAKPTKKFEMTMFLAQEWYRVSWKKEVLSKYASESVMLDGAILNHEVLKKILGIVKVREDKRMQYVVGLDGIEDVVRLPESGIFRIAFCLFPVLMDEIVQIANENKTLPPKSTWFEPRIKNGLIVKAF